MYIYIYIFTHTSLSLYVYIYTHKGQYRLSTSALYRNHMFFHHVHNGHFQSSKTLNY